MPERTEPLPELIEGINVNWSYDELGKHGEFGLKTTSYGRGYPQVAFYLNGDSKIRYWVDFEYDLSKIRHIERADKFGRRTQIYERHTWTWWIR